MAKTFALTRRILLIVTLYMHDSQSRSNVGSEREVCLGKNTVFLAKTLYFSGSQSLNRDKLVTSIIFFS